MNGMLKCIAALFISAVLAWPVLAWAEEANVSPKSKQSQVCPENECKPYDPRFKGVERVALYVHLSAEYKYAVECHEDMNECLKRMGSRDFPEKNVEIRQRLANVYKGLPQALHADNLLELVKTRIDQEVMPHVKSQESCRQPEIIIDRGNNDSYLLADLTKDPNALIIDVSVRFFDDANPRIALLYLYAYRVGGLSHRQVFPSELMVIPLDLSEEKITEKVNNFVHSFDVVTTCEMSRSPG